MSHDPYMIPEGGVCGAFNSASDQNQRVSKRAGMNPSALTEEKLDWNRVPSPKDDPWIRVAEVVEDINDNQFVPTQVLKDTLDMVRRQKGDEPSTDQQTALTLIKDELGTRKDDPEYAADSTKDARRRRAAWESPEDAAGYLTSIGWTVEGGNGQWTVTDPVGGKSSSLSDAELTALARDPMSNPTVRKIPNVSFEDGTFLPNANDNPRNKG